MTRRSVYLRCRGKRGLRPAHEVEDEDDEQNDHEEPDQSITCPCDSERHVFLLRRCQTQVPIATQGPNLTTRRAASTFGDPPTTRTPDRGGGRCRQALIAAPYRVVDSPPPT